MSMKMVRSALIIIILTIAWGCNTMIGERGNGVVVTHRHDMDEFYKVEIEGSFNVLLEPGDTPAVTITTDENLHDFITVENQGNTLWLGTNKNLVSRDGVNVVIYYQGLRSLDVGGAAVLRSDQTVEGDYLRISMAGAGAIELDVDLKALDLDLSGAGAVELSGRTVEQNIEMNGAGGLDAGKLISDRCDISISGVGGANINVREKLVASVSGIGGISYRGNPADVQSDVSGIGKISREDDIQQEEQI